MNQPLPDGLVLRGAQPSDLEQITNLLTERGDHHDAIDHRLVVEDPDAGWESCAVVVDGERVVSTATLLDETLILDGLPVAAGQVELVATDREFEGRGLVRALMDWAHERSAARGHLVQVMIGIPYFYRQFGYQYAITVPPSRVVRGPVAPDDEHVVRTASAGDIAAMSALQDRVQTAYDLRLPHSPACWRWLVARAGSTQLLVERAGVPVATGRLTSVDEDEDEVVLSEVAATDPGAAHALLAHAVSVAGPRVLKVVERAGHFLDCLEPPSRQAEQYYIRVPDTPALLEHLRPVLSARLAASGFAQDSGDVVISFFRHHVRMAYANATVADVRPGGTMQAPASVGGAGVAPDLVGPLLFGPHGILGLSERHPDVYPGPNEELMATLFPPVRSDLLTFYLP